MNIQTSAEYIIALDCAPEPEGHGKILLFPSTHKRFDGHVNEPSHFLEVTRETSGWEKVLYGTIGLSALGVIATALKSIALS